MRQSESNTDPVSVANRSTTSVGRDERDQVLLDDLRVEIARLADAVERQNELLADGAGRAEEGER